MDSPRSLSRRELREFGLTTGGLFALVFGLALPWIRHRAYPTWPWIALGVLGGAALVAPSTLKYVHRSWTALGWALGWINSRIVLTVIFYCLITPLGVLLRLGGYNPMAKNLERDRKSYRIPSRVASPESMERPF